jgi:hypothetical protein
MVDLFLGLMTVSTTGLLLQVRFHSVARTELICSPPHAKIYNHSSSKNIHDLSERTQIHPQIPYPWVCPLPSHMKYYVGEDEDRRDLQNSSA